LNWKGDQVLKNATDIAIHIQADLIYQAGYDARNRLWPGHGVDTGTMKRRTHSAKPGYNWSEHVPASTNAPGIPHRYILPELLRGKYSLELGCGQEYTIYYHQKKDPFLRIPFEEAMSNFLQLVEKAWGRAFD